MDVLGRIEELRNIRKWTNYQLAREAGIAEGSLNNMFRRKNTPMISTLEAICSGLGVTLSQFFEGQDAELSLTTKQKELVTVLDKLTCDQQDALLAFLKCMTSI